MKSVKKIKELLDLLVKIIYKYQCNKTLEYLFRIDFKILRYYKTKFD